ncbi:MAG: hypothetical protein HY954_02610 [Deltaproteobacteria bacterium]|nr:hypothetical protein [Deltaproteobacteria bacterium]
MARKSFFSPTGGYEVSFTQLKSANPSGEGVSISYRINFFTKGGPLLSTVPFNNGKLTEAGIFKKLIWAPKDGFVILPPEMEGGSSRAIALDPKLPWKESPFQLDNFVWIDDLSGVGNRRGSCNYGVFRFDGGNGKEIPVKKPESPIGYELISVKNNTAFIKMFLDDCRMQDIPPRCLSYDLANGVETPASCPPVKPPQKPSKNR